MIYLDHNSTTTLLPEVLDAMRPHLAGLSGNPSSAHQGGRQARRALDEARENIAARLGAWPDEVLFTSGATESNNLAIFGLANDPPGHVIDSPLEHPSVVEPVRQLVARGWQQSRLQLDELGRIRPDSLTAALVPETRLVAIQFANHEVGTIQDVAGLTKLVPETVPVHCDATQAVGKIGVDFHRLGVVTLAFSGHKIHGPRGIGVLLLQREQSLRPLFFGGNQQRGLRPGTEPLASIVGLATALRLACEQQAERTRIVRMLRARFIEGLGDINPVLNGPTDGGIPHTVNLSFPGFKGDLLLMNFDLEGIACSTGSACSSGSLLPSPLLTAMNAAPTNLMSAIRFSLSHVVPLTEIDEAARRIVRVIQRLRQGPSIGA